MKRLSVSAARNEGPAPEEQAVERTFQPAPKSVDPTEACAEAIPKLSYKQCLVIEDFLKSRKLEARDEAIRQALDLMGPGSSVTFEDKQYKLENGEVTCV